MVGRQMLGLQVVWRQAGGRQAGGRQEACSVLPLQAERCCLSVELTLMELVQLLPRPDLVELWDPWLVLLCCDHSGTSWYLGAAGGSHSAVAR